MTVLNIQLEQGSANACVHTRTVYSFLVQLSSSPLFPEPARNSISCGHLESHRCEERSPEGKRASARRRYAALMLNADAESSRLCRLCGMKQKRTTKNAFENSRVEVQGEYRLFYGISLGWDWSVSR